MQRRDLAIGAVVLVVIVAIVFLIQQRRQNQENPLLTPTATPTASQQEQKIEEKFNVQIPENVDKANLIDTRGRGFSGIATRELSGGVFNFNVLADLPDPDEGKVYQAWLRNNSDTRKLGTLTVAKGGFLLDVSLSQDLTSFKTVIISQESVNDNTVEQAVLQGSF